MNFEPFLNEYGLKIPCLIFITLLGICIGSFLNVLIFRIPRKEEFVKTSSHCLTCGHKLAWYDNIPLISYILIKGKCRYCGVKLSKQYPIIEAVNGLLWLSIFLLNGINADSILISLMTSGLLAMSVIDFKTYEIPDGFHFYFGALALVHLFLHKEEWLAYIIGFFSVSILLLLIYLFSKGRAIGGGDVKLMAVCGMFLGWKGSILALFIGCVVGAIIHLTRMKISKADRVLAMGPYLAFGIITSALFGSQIISWYMTLFNF